MIVLLLLSKMKHVIASFGIFSLPKNSFLMELAKDIPYMSDSTLELMRVNCTVQVANMIDRELAFRHPRKEEDPYPETYEEDSDDFDDYAYDEPQDDDFHPFGEYDNDDISDIYD